MAVRRVQLRRGTTQDHTVTNGGFTGAVGEITVDTDTKSIRVHDGAQAGGFDLMRADMSNDNFAAGNITIAEGVGAHTLTIGANTTTVAIAGNLSVAGTTTQANALTVDAKLITVNANGNGAPEDLDSIGVIFERYNDGNPGAQQDNAFMIWREDGDYFVLGTGAVTENTAEDFVSVGTVDFAYTDLYLRTLYAQTSVDVNDGDITNVGEIQLDSIIYNDDLNTITIKAKDNQVGAFVVKADAGDEEAYISIDATNATESLTLGVPARTTTIRSSSVDLGTDAANDVTLEVVARTGVNNGQSLTIKAGSAPTGGAEDLNGGNLIFATGAGDGTGTASIQFQTKVANTDTVAERMRIHTDGNVGIGDNAPGTLLQLSGADAYLTLKNTTVENGDGGAETKIIFEDHGDNALGQIEVSHQGGADDEFGQMIFSTNNDAGLQTALTIDKDQKATFEGVVSVATSLDMTDGAINNVTTIDLDKITDRANDGIIIEIHDGQATGLVVEDTTGLDFITCNSVADTITLHQATTLSSTLAVNGGSATIQGAEGGNAELFLMADESDDPGDNWRVQATDHATRTLTFAGETNVADAYADVLTLTGGDTSAASSATVKGTLIVEGEIQSATDLVFQVDNDNNGNNKFSFQAGDNSEVATLTEAGVLTVTGVSNLNGGIAVDTTNFTVDGATGATVIQSTLGVYGNLTLDDIGDNAAPNLVINNTDGSTKFQVLGATGNTTIEGTSSTTGIATFKDSLAIQSQPVNDLGIQFNSDRGADNINGADYDVKVIDVFKGTGNATQGTILWDDDESSFSVTSGKLNSETQFSVGPIATPNFTVVPTTGAVNMVGTDAYLTLQNNVNEFNDGGAETQIQFQDHAGLNLSTIQASHEGGVDDAKGQLLFYTNTGAENDEGTLALTISSAQLATFEGNVTVSGNTITFGNTATIVNGAADTLTITEDNIKFAGVTHITAASGAPAILYMSADASEDNGDDWRLQATDGNLFSIASDINGAYQDFFSVTGNVDTTLSTTTVAGLLKLEGASITGATDANLSIISDSNLIFKVDSDNDGVATFQFNIHDNSTVAEIDESGNLQIDGDLTVSGDDIKDSGENTVLTFAGDGSDVTVAKELTVIGDGLGGANINLGANDGLDSVITVIGRSGVDNIGGNDLTIQAGASTGAANGGSILFKTSPSGAAGGAQNNPTTALTLRHDNLATFEGNVIIKGNLDIQQTGTNTVIDSTSLVVADPVIELARNADNAQTASTDVGFVFTRGSTEHPAVIYWDEDLDKFVLATKNGAVAGTTDFSAGNAPVEARLDVGTLNADVITIDDNDGTSLVISEGGTPYLTFNTLNDPGNGNPFEQVEFGKIFTAISGSKIGNLTLANDSITSSGGAISFGDENLSTTGALEVSGLADLNGGIDVNGSSFTVDAAGAVKAVGTLSLTDASGGIVFNSDRTGNGDEKEAPMLTVERGLLTNAILAWDETNDEFNINSVSGVHLVGKNASNALTVGGATSAAGGVTFSVTTAGAVNSVGGITDTTVASSFATGTTLGNVTYSDNEIAGADDQDLTIKSEQDLIFQVDSDQVGDVAGNNSFFFKNGGAGTILTLAESGDLTITGDTTIATTKSLTLNSGVVDAVANVDAYIYVDRGTDDDVAIRWDEGVNRWMHTNDGTSYYNILNSNDTLVEFAVDAIGSTNISIEQGDGTTVTFNGNSGANNAGLEFSTNGNAINLAFESTVKLPGDLTLVAGGAQGSIDCHNLTVNNDTVLNGAKVKLKDNILFMGLGNTSNANDLGFYARYADSDNGDADRFAGLTYDVSGNVWKLFDQETTANLNVNGEALTISPTDAMLASIDLSSLTAVSSINVKSSTDNTSPKVALTLNSDQSGVPAGTEDVSIAVERGDSTNATLTWDEGDDRWTLDNGEGSTNAIVTVKRSEGARPETVGTSNNGGGGDLQFTAGDRLDLTGEQPTAYENEHIYFLNNNATIGTVDLFTLAGTTYNGYKINFVNTDSVNMVIDANTQAGQTINGQNTQTIPAGGNLTIVAYGTAWYIL
jgi:hypothetical protein